MKTSRRQLFGGTGALIVAAVLRPGRAAAAEPMAGLAPNAFVRITPDSKVTVIIKAVEFGQGSATGLATLVAEELDADWADVGIEFAPANDELYKNLIFGTMAVGGSTTIRNSYTQMREAGATARAMMAMAAARLWKVDPAVISVKSGVVSAGRRSARFGELAVAAAAMPPPATIELKDPSAFSLVGKRIPRLDSRAKSDGSARFACDVRARDMVIATVAHPPLFGATLVSFDAADAMAVPGVIKVAETPSGVAVFARNSFAALKGRAALHTKWDDSAAEKRSSAALESDAAELASDPPVAVIDGPAWPADLPAGSKTVHGRFVFPYLAHAPMETLDAVVRKIGDRVEVTMGSQFQTSETATIAAELGVTPDRATLDQCYAGGSFGRRATPDRAFPIEAGQVCAAWGGPEAVKIMWSREDDLTGGYYRPMMVHDVRAAITPEGEIAVWHHGTAGQSIVFGTPMSARADERGHDRLMFEGADEPAYRFKNHRLGVGVLESPVTTCWWRSVGASHTGYVMEAMMDRLFAAAAIDPVAGRLRLVEDPRGRAVIERAAEIAGWGTKQPAGHALGIAYMKSFGTHVAHVVRVSRGVGGLPKVDRVWAAVDCGAVVNPDIVRAQTEGGVGFALGHALHAEITFADGGVVEQRNFDDYASLRMSEMPEVTVAIVESGAEPTGIGEPPVPPLAPAVANGWLRLTGQAVQRLPFVRGIAEDAA